MLAALDELPKDALPASRVVVSGDDGQSIRLALFTEAGVAAAVEPDPTGAMAIARDLINTALPRLNGE